MTTRRLIVTAFLGSFIATFLLARPVKISKPEPVDEAYPLERGMRWTYRGPAGITVMREVFGESDIDGRHYYHMRYDMPIFGTRTLPMRRTPEGTVTVAEGREYLLNKFPMKTGDRWRIDVPGEPQIADCEVVGTEEIEFAGLRDLATKLRIVRSDRKTGKPSLIHEWYAYGYGLVRIEVTYGVRANFVLERFDRSVKP